MGNWLFHFYTPESLTLSQMLRIIGMGQQGCWGYGSWKPVLQVLCSSSGKDSEQNQGYLHQYLSSVKVMSTGGLVSGLHERLLRMLDNTKLV